jgi:hypothetical protein
MTPPNSQAPPPDSDSDRGSALGVPTRSLGATAVVDCEIWSTDFRERLERDDPLRKGFESSPATGSKESVTRLAKLHNVALRLTRVAP